jgi:Fe-Mn family superoxide dismutase
MSNFRAQIPFGNSDLIPFLSPETLEYHYGKHHCGYADTLNKLAENTEYEGKTLEEIIEKTRMMDKKVYNNASQLFYHNFYWQCLKVSDEKPKGKLKHMIERRYDSIENFLDRFVAHANTMFGSGWCCLVADNEHLDFVNVQNAEAVSNRLTKICIIDLWEHAYYIDYRNNRAEYLNKIIRQCINWGFCEKQVL